LNPKPTNSATALPGDTDTADARDWFVAGKFGGTRYIQPLQLIDLVEQADSGRQN
jgi:hypothetical protein